MNKKNQSPKNQPQELSYYRLSLLAFLKESHPELANDTGFIAARGDSAAEAYSETVRSGFSHDAATEIANKVLFANLHFSKYDTIVTILWNEFEDEVLFAKKCSSSIRYPMISLLSRSSTTFIQNSPGQS